MMYQVKLVCLVNTLLQEPLKKAHVIPNLEKFLNAFLRKPYPKELKDLTGTLIPISKREPSVTVACRGRAYPNHSLQFGPISNSLRHQIILSFSENLETELRKIYSRLPITRAFKGAFVRGPGVYLRRANKY